MEKEKQMNQKIESSKLKTKAIEYIVGVAVGFPVAVYIGRGKNNETEFQIMPEDEFKSGVEDFFDWHIENNQQWFESPIIAAAEFVRKYQQFRTKDIKPTIQTG